MSCIFDVKSRVPEPPRLLIDNHWPNLATFFADFDAYFTSLGFLIADLRMPAGVELLGNTLVATFEC